MAKCCFNMAFLLVAILVASSVQHSAAQTTHVVGDSMGWTIPSGGDQVYRVWADNQNFTVGDALVFDFPTGHHDVAQVSKADYDSCISSNPLSVDDSGPATIKLNSSGEHYFICNYGHHCVAGQKLAIKVRATESGPPPTESMAPGTTNVFRIPSEPLPSPIAAPPSSSSSLQQVTYIVGDALYWTVPAYVGANPDFYQIWASNKPFKVGDKLVFNYVTRRHKVAQVDKLGYETCDASFSTLPEYSTSPTSITLDSAGEYFFICDDPAHCLDGQKLAITVTDTTSSSSTSSPAATTSNSASFIGVVEVSATILSIVVSFFLV